MVARCRFAILGVLCAAAVLLVGAATPAGASITPLQWHRVDIYGDPPNHERWCCLTDGEWRCLFDNVPEPTLGFAVSGVRGVFTGTEVTGSWECPSWFPGEPVVGVEGDSLEPTAQPLPCTTFGANSGGGRASLLGGKNRTSRMNRLPITGSLPGPMSSSGVHGRGVRLTCLFGVSS